MSLSTIPVPMGRPPGMDGSHRHVEGPGRSWRFDLLVGHDMACTQAGRDFRAVLQPNPVSPQPHTLASKLPYSWPVG